MKRMYVSASEFARIVGVDRSTVVKWIISGIIDATKVGRMYAIPVSEIEKGRRLASLYRDSPVEELSVLKCVMHLVALRMAGLDSRLMIIMNILRGRLSISEAAHRLGISKHVVRGWRERIRERCGNTNSALILFDKLWSVIQETVQPIFERDHDSSYRCRLCGINVPGEQRLPHVVTAHRILVKQRTIDIIERYLSSKGNGDSIR